MEIKLIIFLITPALIVSGFLLFDSQTQEPISPEKAISGLLTIQGNSLLNWSPLPSPKVVKRIKMIATAYSSTIQQTDNDPFITAAGTWVRDGIVANNLFPFGTKIRIPELYGDKIFIVEDRMNSKKGYYHIDIWFPSYWEAKNFGAKRTYVEILES
ncbi:hypothetical protein ES703_44348 [subsurface metagenome]